jgi:hypothetical protein
MPRISAAPINVSPHSFTKFVKGSMLGLASQWKNPVKVFAPSRYPAAEKLGFRTFVMPAQKKSQPMVMRSRKSEIVCARFIKMWSTPVNK